MATLDTNVNMVPAGEGSSCSGPSNTTPQSSKKFKRFEIKKWNAVSIWADTAVEECAHCRCHIMDLCLDCKLGSGTREECSVAWGVCNHAFHFHCISRWLKRHNVCVHCNGEWGVSEVWPR